MNRALVALVCLIATTCAGATSTTPANADGDGGEGDRVDANVITAAPSTFEVALADEARQRLERDLESGSLDVARLTLRDLRPRAADSLKGVRIFIEKPDADADTPVDDPHYATSFVLGLGAPQTTLWNVAPTIARLRRLGALEPRVLQERKSLRVTFVPEPWDFATALPHDFALPFADLSLEIPP